LRTSFNKGSPLKFFQEKELTSKSVSGNLFPAMKVQVYYNLHKDRLSIRSAKSGLVINHADFVVLNNVKLHVQPTGQYKVRRDKRKNVHAYVSGDLASKHQPDGEITLIPRGSFDGMIADEAYYNPYKNDFFVNSKGEELRDEYKTVHIIGKKIYYQ